MTREFIRFVSNDYNLSVESAEEGTRVSHDPIQTQ